MTPKIRFKKFTDDWVHRPLDSVAIPVRRKDPRSTAPIKMISAADGFINQSQRYAFDNAGKSLQNYTVLQQGELAYNHGASKLRPFGSCFVLRDDEARVPYVYHTFSVKGDPAFFEHELNTHEIQEQLRTMVTSGARMDGLLNITFDQYAQIILSLPTDAEQKSISTFLDQLDNLIALQKQKLDQLKNLKTGLLARLFPAAGSDTPTLRFSGFTGPWEQHCLRDVVDIVGGGTPSTSNPDYWNGNIDWYSPSEIGTSVFANGSVRKITQKGLKNSSAKLLPPHRTVLFTSRASIGDMAILRHPAATNQGFQSFIASEAIDPYFLYSSGHLIKRHALAQAAGSTFLEVSPTRLGSMEYFLPSLDEQQKIACLCQSFDELITGHQQKLAKLRDIKGAFLSKMFPSD